MPPKPEAKKPPPPKFFTNPHSLYYSTLFDQEYFDRIPVRGDLFSQKKRDDFVKKGSEAFFKRTISGATPPFDRENFVGFPPEKDLYTLQTMYQTFLKETAFLAFCSNEREAGEELQKITQQEEIIRGLNPEKQKLFLKRQKFLLEQQEFMSRALDTVNIILNHLDPSMSEQTAKGASRLNERPYTKGIARYVDHADVTRAQLALDNAVCKIHPFERFCEDNDALAVHADLLELSHNWVQILFPTDELSQHGAVAVLLDDYDRDKISHDQDLQATLLFHFAIAMKFYGFYFSMRIVDDRYDIQLTQPTDPAQIARWTEESFHHNYLRITRILRSLKLCGLDNTAQLFLHTLKIMSEDEQFQIPEDCYPKYWVPALAVKVLGEVAQLARFDLKTCSNIRENLNKIISSVDPELQKMPEKKGFFSRLFFPSVPDPAFKAFLIKQLYSVLNENVSSETMLDEFNSRILQVAAIARGGLQIMHATTENDKLLVSTGFGLVLSNILQKTDPLFLRQDPEESEFGPAAAAAAAPPPPP